MTCLRIQFAVVITVSQKSTASAILIIFNGRRLLWNFYVVQKQDLIFFSSLGVRRRRRRLSSLTIFQTSSPLKLLNGFEWNLTWLFLSISCTKCALRFLIRQKTWPPLLKIEHRGQMQFLAYISKTKALRANLTWSKNVH